MSEGTSSDPQVARDRERHDVATIMAEIRERNRLRREQGQIGDEELEERARERLRSWARSAHLDPRLLERFLKPTGHDWNIATDYLLRTHRRGALAQLSLLGKRIVRPLVRLYTDHVLNRQAQINQYVVELLHESIRETLRLEAQLQALRHRCDRLEAGLGGGGAPTAAGDVPGSADGAREPGR
jgi:chorismate mutase